MSTKDIELRGEMQMLGKRLALAAPLSVLALGCFGSAAQAETFTLRIAAGYPLRVVHAGLMKNLSSRN